MTLALCIIGIVAGLASLALGAWHRRGPSTSILCARYQEPDELLPDGRVRKGDIVHLRRW